MIIDPEKLVELVKVYQATQDLLGELEKLGFKCKRVAAFDFQSGTGWPVWRRIGEECGIIHFPDINPHGTSVEARSVAHEMGHGFYECLDRDYILPPEFLTPKSGEDFAEAIRWWVEQQLGPSQWQPQNTNVLNKVHHSFEEFKNWLRTLNRKQTSQPATGAAPTPPLSPRPSPGSP